MSGVLPVEPGLLQGAEFRGCRGGRQVGQGPAGGCGVELSICWGLGAWCLCHVGEAVWSVGSLISTLSLAYRWQFSLCFTG